MKKPKLDISQEITLSTSEFKTHLENYQQNCASNIPVILLIAEAKDISETDGDCDDRKVSMPQYGNSQMDAFYFYKPISTIIIDDD